MSDCKARFTPSEKILNVECDAELTNASVYRKLVGSLIYLKTCTRPDLSWTVSKVSQYLSEPRECHMTAAKHVLGYLRGTLDKELCYKKGEVILQLVAYCDADWAADQDDRRNTTGYCFSLNKSGTVVSWKSKKFTLTKLPEGKTAVGVGGLSL